MLKTRLLQPKTLRLFLDAAPPSDRRIMAAALVGSALLLLAAATMHLV